ncbi:extracellular serine-rich protein [Paraphaeosphaeria minitans]|uniref:Extracellular serine-rich protein n=1 Tax=Paraphaeosphaeria minitans TaxID=565426 RepID=A0A9P6G3V5_9PLEO|nr:extracellular serine-rich protein [Paraphaeosphaeria minitans]
MTRWGPSTATLAIAASGLFTLGLTQTTMAEVASTTSSGSPDSQSATTAPSATGTTSSSTSTSSEPQIHLVKVGAGGFQFEPAELNNVSVGDIVTYEFYPLDHSVARAEYGSACVPYEYTGKDRIGFWSKTQWVETANDITHWNLTINSTEPIFYYCAAPDSCKRKLMVGAINPNSTHTLDAQIRAAEKADFQVAPGEAVPNEASSTLLAPSTTSSQQVSASANHHHPGLSVAAIVGIVFGGIAFIAFCAAVLFYVARKAQVRGRDAPSTQHPASVDTTSSPNVAECPPPFSPFTPEDPYPP